MEYFKILNLEREPFSNSPEPDFFFQSDQHLACLQKLELAIRLRRGLNVVIGDVGLGKTTLCRQIILKFSRSEADRDQIETHLIMDPSFSGPLEFLSTVALLLGVDAATDDQSEWQIKENIKKYLFKRGIDEGKIVVLIVDEGQKLPVFCMEILREFLNYETNEYKLLQIVIFAQREFESVLRAHANFADRVNHYIYVLPLDFKNTRNMIAFRMATAAADAASVPAFFTLPALWALQRETEGHPRKINTLCHQALLTMIIQNRLRVGYFLVRACAARVKLADKSNWLPRRSFILAMAVLILLLFVTIYGWNTLYDVTGKRALMKSWSPVAELFSPRASANKRPSMISKVENKPQLLGQLVMKNDEQITTILERIYGRDATTQMALFAKANPHLKNLEVLKQGESISLPARAKVSQPLPPGKYWIQISSLKSLSDAYQFISLPANAGRVFLLSYWKPQEGLTFAILLKDGFDDEATAQSFRKTLPSSYEMTASVVSGWNDAVFL